MKTLETMAAEMFHNFAKQEGISADWNYLSPNRRLAWMEDVMIVMNYFMDEIAKEIRPLKQPGQLSTVGERFFFAGQMEERKLFHQMTEDIHNQLKQQLEDAENTLK